MAKEIYLYDKRELSLSYGKRDLLAAVGTGIKKREKKKKRKETYLYGKRDLLAAVGTGMPVHL